jgi:hypothetical protein
VDGVDRTDCVGPPVLRHSQRSARQSDTAPGGQQIATVACNSTGRFGPIARFNTPPLTSEGGSFAYHGFIDLPAACRDHPEDLAFMVRHLAPLEGRDVEHVLVGPDDDLAVIFKKNWSRATTWPLQTAIPR